MEAAKIVESQVHEKQPLSISVLPSDGNTSRSESPSSRDEKKSRSLEALFQVTHEELQHMSNKNTSDARTIYLVKEGNVLHQIQSSSPSNVGQVQQSSAQNSNVFATLLMSNPDGTTTPTPVIIAQQFNQVQSEATEVQIRNDNEGQQMFPYSPTPPNVGRKRKHPQKPGKYQCSYCGRLCAKPSVLEKHIRAHTNERPYPCTMCSFSFKTKSNLYKHQKSRQHRSKVSEISGREGSSLDLVNQHSLDDDQEDNGIAEPSFDEEDKDESKDKQSEAVDILRISADQHKGSQVQVRSNDGNTLYIINSDDLVQLVSRHVVTSSQSTVGSTAVDLSASSSSYLPKWKSTEGTSDTRTPPRTPVTHLHKSQSISNSKDIQERIEKLIEQNTNILQAPMAEAPRPKKPSRQNSIADKSQQPGSYILDQNAMEQGILSLANLTNKGEGSNRLPQQFTIQIQVPKEQCDASSVPTESLAQKYICTCSAKFSTEQDLIAHKANCAKSTQPIAPKINTYGRDLYIEHVDPTEKLKKGRPKGLKNRVSTSDDVGRPKLRLDIPAPNINLGGQGLVDSPVVLVTPTTPRTPDTSTKMKLKLKLMQRSISQEKPTETTETGRQSPQSAPPLQKYSPQDPSQYHPLKKRPIKMASVNDSKTAIVEGNQVEDTLPKKRSSHGISKLALDGDVTILPNSSAVVHQKRETDNSSAISVTPTSMIQMGLTPNQNLIPVVETETFPDKSPIVIESTALDLRLPSVQISEPKLLSHAATITSLPLYEQQVLTVGKELLKKYMPSVNINLSLEEDSPVDPSSPPPKRKKLTRQNCLEEPDKSPTNTQISADKRVSTPLSSPTKLPWEKVTLALYLHGHNYPQMRTGTHVTFCSLSRLQPTYVETGQRHISMYSNWKTTSHNPNPDGLTSRLLLKLHRLYRENYDPKVVVSKRTKTGEAVMTHSSYWTNKMDKSDGKDEEKESPQLEASLKLENLVKKSMKERDVPPPPTSSVPPIILIDSSDKETLVSQSNVVMQSSNVELLQVPDSATRVDRVHLTRQLSVDEELQRHYFLAVKAPKLELTKRSATTDATGRRPQVTKVIGGFKTDETYTYVRGRGRGKYVCSSCGIRCKKPSMLKKHLRSHTELRPYRCLQCSFSFKTKGNLTKHMKSKAHQKKCIESGIVPVPSAVDDGNIDQDLLRRQMALEEQVASLEHLPDDDEEEDANVQTVDHEVTIVGDEHVVEGEEIVMTSNDWSEDAEASGKLVNIIQEEQNPQYITKEQAEPIAIVKTHDTSIKAPRASLDKEIAAHSLLDLSSGKQDEEDEAESVQGQVIGRKKSRKPDKLFINLQDMPTKLSTITMKTPSVEHAAEDISRHLSGSTAGFIPPKANHEAVIVEPLPRNRPEDLEEEESGIKIQRINLKNDKELQARPIMVDDSESLVNGKYLCKTCGTTFSKLQQFNMHKNVHAVERPWKCKECNVSFRNEGQLQKHHRSETHAKQVVILQQFGAVSAENPRPYQCHHCNIGFRVHGHLTKHLRSKGHVQKLEALSLLPPGSLGILEKRDLSEVDASDCDTALNSLKNIVEESEQQKTKKNTTQENESYRLKCGLCHMKNFESIHKLQEHMSFTHLEIRPYVCQYCDAGFTNADKLQQHMSSHVQDSKWHTSLNESEVTTSSEDEESKKRKLDEDDDDETFIPNKKSGS
ncbi:DgyrCDS3653 [Dimorphilus gyrociliatus]|uniref:DgyrCDS3653 n=1 Tax=Dimorphilus gyrociliatus TaxID=2664684 RepID=A0A7I8VGK8_9ANNE|nr:DgyrCDS3653 [Dimorphilus gyrociliatus]